ncbi:flavocytochrome c [Shewanella youngdeokensis]|uniref:Flavocytochrome c n=1 Tax=Shewanella youngdeokensis TaxID=2999068 RepID=A0ABZ0JYU7_9GAMM|nr:flavocytochrome c [Shewanella sp. DAU334]
MSNNIKNNLSRRDFLKAGGAATAATGLSLAGISSATAATCSTLPEKWDETYDVVVVGSGFAGLSAAIEAKNANASTVVLEKMPVPGGNSTINGGCIAVVGSDVQKARGITDSVDAMMGDMLKAGLGLNYPLQARIVAERTNEAYEWCKNYLGVKFKDKITQFGGHSIPRSLTTQNQSGSGIILPMLAKAKELDIHVKTKVYVKKLINDEQGRIVGLEVITRFKPGKETSTKTKFIKAKKGVVMANGGFAADVNYRSSQDPRLDEKLRSTNHSGATAECLKEMVRIGANPVQLSWVQLGPWTSPEEKGFGMAPLFATYSAFAHGIMVSPKTGERFVNELADRKVRADAIVKTGDIGIAFCDSIGASHSSHVMDKLLGRKVVLTFDTFEELAAHYKIPVKALLAQIERYNSYVEKNIDPEFGKPFSMKQVAIKKAPFYAVRLWPKAHHTMGGVEIDTKARVMNMVTRDVIPGLFACGEATGGTHGACRLGTVAVPDCLVFGRIAGQNAAKA